MTRRNIFAHTAPGTNYPEFVSINLEEDGTISVTVRNPAKPDGSCGEIAMVKLSVEESIRLVGQFETIGSKE